MTSRWPLLIFAFFTATPAFAGNPFVIHEWGTFTSFQSESGDSLYGLQRGDEPLPQFVYLRNPTTPQEPSHSTLGCRRNSYSCDWQPIAEPVGEHRMGVTQRMETPVIYFHSDIPRDVQVKVDFPQGIITEWFPKASSFVPAIGEVNQIASGSMTWDVQVHTDRLALPAIPKGSIWAPSRQVDANDISTGGENERLIFYRGVGDFSTNFRVNANASDFRLSNTSDADQVPEVIYIHVTDQGGFARSLGPINGGSFTAVPYAESSQMPLMPMKDYLENASGLMEKILSNEGLYRDEALALVNTWKHAYFETKGERFLYILPRAWTDRLLPMTITPAPDRLERALVGRVEVMNLNDSNAIHSRIFAAAQEEPQAPLFTGGMGPFAEQLLELASARNNVKREEALLRELPDEERTVLRLKFRRANKYIQDAITLLQQ